jgi:hypothetical protein
MVLNDSLRAFIETDADEFIYNPVQYIGMAKESNATNIVDYVLGFFEGRLMTNALHFVVENDIPDDEAQYEEFKNIIYRREHEVVDAVQREIEKIKQP